MKRRSDIAIAFAILVVVVAILTNHAMAREPESGPEDFAYSNEHVCPFDGDDYDDGANIHSAIAALCSGILATLWWFGH